MTDRRSTDPHREIRDIAEEEVRPEPADAGDAAEEAETVRLLRGALDRLDTLAPVFEPELHRLEARLEEHAAFLRRRLIRDLALFLTVASIVLSGLAAVILKVPAVFLLLQAAALAAAPVFIIGFYRKKVNSR